MSDIGNHDKGGQAGGDVEERENLVEKMNNHDALRVHGSGDDGGGDDGDFPPVEDDDVHDPDVSSAILENVSDGSDSDGSDSDGSDSDGSDSDGSTRLSNQNRQLRAANRNLKAENRSLIRSRARLADRSREICLRDQQKIRDLERRKKELVEANVKLQARLDRVPLPIVPWSTLLREYLKGNPALSYRSIYRKSCKQENMSMTLAVFHPDFCLQMEESSRPQKYMSRETALPENMPPDRHPPQLEWRPFPFEELPFDIQAKIFRLVFVRRALVHCLSRLDPFVAPSDFPGDDEMNRSQLPKKFHFGTSPCQIRRARKPNDVLRPLLVCKRWYFIGVHAFYGANTFAFSSLGEWHRFCNGIGCARVERIVNVELMWHGALMPTQNPQLSLRSIGLKWFEKTRRLRTLVVHIAESAKWRRRRKHETYRRDIKDDGNLRWNERPNGGLFDDDGIVEDDSDEDQSDQYQSDGDQSDRQRNAAKIKMLIRRTSRHPNSRQFRSMRTVQGMDEIYQLRGMKWVRFKERNGDEHRQSIRDWSFLKDVNSSVTKPKQPVHSLMSELENLTPLSGLADWIPTQEDMRLIRSFYDETPTIDPLGGSDTSESVGSASTVIEISDSDSDADDGSSSSSSSDSSSPSSGLFVREGSGSPGGPPADPPTPMEDPPEPTGDSPDPMDIDDNNPEGETFNDNALDGAESEDGLFVPSGSGSAPPPSRVVIDLTGDDDSDDEALFSHSSSSSDQVKSEPESNSNQDLSNQINNMSLNNDNDNSDDHDADDHDADDERGFEREESPPDSDDESNVGSTSSSKRSREASASSDDEERASQSPRFERKHTFPRDPTRKGKQARLNRRSI
ncbi:hypothetical protein F4818DRAFT_439721 [Hypoxylon cercidicola]|nr:hypothetical protein F4818DRAFT_439721 [Hypoxylon cercidicola]